MKSLRMVWFIFSSLIALLICGSIIIVIGFFDSKKNFTGKIAIIWAKLVLKGSGIKAKVKGLDKLKTGQNYIFVSNHESILDIPLALSLLPRNIIFLTKKELFMIPFFGIAMKAAGMIIVNRQNKDEAKKSVNHALKSIKMRNISVLVYPEGTRSDPGLIMPFKKGSFILAIKSGLPIVPITTLRTGLRVERRKLLMSKFNDLELVVHRPISTNDLDVEKDKSSLMQEVHQIIKNELINSY